jgi:hypothetical protein
LPKNSDEIAINFSKPTNNFGSFPETISIFFQQFVKILTGQGVPPASFAPTANLPPKLWTPAKNLPPSGGLFSPFPIFTLIVVTPAINLPQMSTVYNIVSNLPTGCNLPLVVIYHWCGQQ